MVKLKDFLNNLYKALNANTCYLQGGFGCRLWVPDYYNPGYSWNKANAGIIKDHSSPALQAYGFDCVCLIKGALWGFAADPKKEYGGSVYKSNGVPDCTTKALSQTCRDLSTDWTKPLDVGELVFYDEGCSHVGVYIGNGCVIESTPAWACGVQKTLLPNITNPEKLPVRKWYSHGHTSYIDYTVENETPAETWEDAYKWLKERFDQVSKDLDNITQNAIKLLGDNNALKFKCEQYEKEIASLKEKISNAKEALK